MYVPTLDFVSRALLFLIVYVLFAFAGRKLFRRVNAVSVFFCFISLATGAYAIYELATNNPNEWLYMKIAFYLSAWLFAVGIAVDDKDMGDTAFWALVTSFAIGVISTLGLGIYGEILCERRPLTHVDREVVEVTYLAAAGDAYQISSKGYAGLLGTTYSISENGVYRYYYIAENGMKAYGSVDAENTYLDDALPDGEQPYLVKYVSYNRYYTMRNNQPVEHRLGVTTRYELHVPAGSVIESFIFDLT